MEIEHIATENFIAADKNRLIKRVKNGMTNLILCLSTNTKVRRKNCLHLKNSFKADTSGYLWFQWL